MRGPEDPRRLMKALFAWASASPKGIRSGGGTEFQDVVLHHRPDPAGPEVQVRFVAAEVNGRPTIRVEYVPDEFAPPPTGGMTINLRDEWEESDEPPRDASKACESCGKVGTAGWIAEVPTEGPPDVHRYCAACWGPEAAWYRARWEETRRLATDEWLRSANGAHRPSPGQLRMRAATWHAALEQVRLVEDMMRTSAAPARQDLAQLADQLARGAPKLEGPMPLEVEAFIQRYR